MLSQIELQRGIEGFLAGSLALEDFEDWLVQGSWNIHKGQDLLAQRIAYAVELRLAEHHDGYLPLQELRGELRALMDAYSFYLPQSSAYVSNGTSTVIEKTQQWSVLPFGMSLATASV